MVKHANLVKVVRKSKERRGSVKLKKKMVNLQPKQREGLQADFSQVRVTEPNFKQIAADKKGKEGGARRHSEKVIRRGAVALKKVGAADGGLSCSSSLKDL